MHANRALALNGSYNIDIGDDPASSPSSIQDIDLSNWLNTLALELPSGDGSVAVASGVVVVTVQWNDSRAEGGATESFQLSTAL